MRAALLILLCALTSMGVSDERFGHSSMGAAFDKGLRQRPWKIAGVGKVHFPVTSKNPEVQEWFDQGVALMHSFWFEEAERSFRWCVKLDPDCAMAYWGMAWSGMNWFSAGAPPESEDMKRYVSLLQEAEKRKPNASPRERMYIDAWLAGYTGEGDRHQALIDKLHQLVLLHPEDVEAKSLLAVFAIDEGPAFSNELLIREVLRENPMHPGAHHYRIHNWDGKSPIEAIKSCQLYGKAAPGIGHANHMPGHIYSKIGMWHEAARAMDAATRIELRYMRDKLAMPLDTWNYTHNRNYLCYIQEQLGMANASIQGARDMLAAPPDEEGERYALYDGMSALARALLKFERWDEILAEGSIPFTESRDDQDQKNLLFTYAYVGKGDVAKAREHFDLLKASVDKQTEKNKELLQWIGASFAACEGVLLDAEGKTEDAEKRLKESVSLEAQARASERFANDPPYEAWAASRLLGDFYLKHGRQADAVAAYHDALKAEPNDGFSLSGLARAHFALGQRDQGKEFYGRLLYVWSNADPGLRWLTECQALGLSSKPIAATPAKEKPYRPAELDRIGPSNWTPYMAPNLECLDVNGRKVRLEDYRGRNVLLVFYLSEQCVHCVEQLAKIHEKRDSFSEADTVVLAVSSTQPEKNKESLKLGELAIQLLSDHDHENARRFASYDDFEEMELHSTILIDKQGRVRWKRTGGDPFMKIDFLLEELGRINGSVLAKK